VADYIVPIGPQLSEAPGQGCTVDEANVPNKDKSKCPFGDKKVKVGLGPVSVGLSCKGAEIEVVAGVAVGATIDGNGVGSIFVGVGVQGNAGPASAGAKAGVNITFDGNSVADVSIKGDVEGGMGYGPGASFSIGAEVGVVAPANLDVGGSLSVSNF
jgi:hypothetical protein